jgi:hypothetical protein
MEAQTVSWINEHKNGWRVALLVVVLVAIMGPWTFDPIFLPPGFSCSAPNIRLDDDFCGTPLPGTWWLYWMVIGFVYASAGLVTGAMGFVEWADVFRVSLLLFLLVLPFFSTLLLILRGDRRRRQIFNIVAWGLAAGIALLMGMSSYPRLFWVLWGSWLYIGLAASALILEVLTLAGGRRPSQG